VYAEFEGKVSRSQLTKIDEVSKVEKFENGWLIESKVDADLRKVIARFGQNNDLLVLTLRKEEESLEAVFKRLTGGK
jgi:hypothetical protein